MGVTKKDEEKKNDEQVNAKKEEDSRDSEVVPVGETKAEQLVSLIVSNRIKDDDIDDSRLDDERENISDVDDVEVVKQEAEITEEEEEKDDASEKDKEVEQTPGAIVAASTKAVVHMSPLELINSWDDDKSGKPSKSRLSSSNVDPFAEKPEAPVVSFSQLLKSASAATTSPSTSLFKEDLESVVKKKALFDEDESDENDLFGKFG
jgi:CRISPR/Cas system-associated endonuclease/helicase Cas3